MKFQRCFGVTFLIGSFCLVTTAQERTEAKRPGAVQVGEPSKDQKLISGPQVGEAFPELPVWLQRGGDQPAEKVDLKDLAAKQSIAVAFMHEKSRPGFGMSRLMSEFAAIRKDKIQCVVVTLTDDRSTSELWLQQVRNYFPESTKLCVAEGGIEGPGSAGLNRLASLTVLVVRDGKVSANFALTQVSNAVDGPKILAAMNEASGGGDVPSIEELMRPRNKRDGQ